MREPDFYVKYRDGRVTFMAWSEKAESWVDRETSGVLLRNGHVWTGRGCDFSAQPANAPAIEDALQTEGFRVVDGTATRR